MNKTATVTVTRPVMHKRTGKLLMTRKKFLIHDEMNALKLDDTVVIRNCPPVSARKRFTLEKVLKSPEMEREKARLAREAQVTEAEPAPERVSL